MQRLLIATLAASIIALSAAVPADAADLAIKAPVNKAPVQAVPSWTGFYVGATVGARFANNDWRDDTFFPFWGGPVAQTSDPTVGMNSTAARFGGLAGFNWQVAPQWVAGVEADFGWANNSASVNPLPGTLTFGGTPVTDYPTATAKETWDSSLRARLGFLITPDLMLFGTGGLAWQRVELSAACPAVVGTATSFCWINESESYAKTRTGWTVGAGLEYRVWGNWLARVDYRYADFGSFDQQFFTTDRSSYDDRFTAHVKLRTQTANLALIYKF